MQRAVVRVMRGKPIWPLALWCLSSCLATGAFATQRQTLPDGHHALATSQRQVRGDTRPPNQANDRTQASKAITAHSSDVRRGLRAGEAEAQLIEAYKLVGQGRTRDALRAVDALLLEHPNFKLALLLQGDLLASMTRPVRRFADVPEAVIAAKAKELESFQSEALSRLKALREPPPAGLVPKEFVRLPTSTRHAVAVDASRSRLYLFENSAKGLRLLSHYYVSLGLAGVAKKAEGDQRTPLGMYFITSSLSPKGLGDLYGSGALPINYPNELDKLRGRTGSGIWLHGMPSDTFARPINATDGCVALANPDLEKLLNTVAAGHTPVLIAPKIDWVPPDTLAASRQEFDSVVEAWRKARVQDPELALKSFYVQGFRSGGRDRGQFARNLAAHEPVKPVSTVSRPVKSARSGKATESAESTQRIDAMQGEFEIRDLSYLSWFDQQANMIVTFSEVAKGNKGAKGSGSVSIRRQYWQRDPSAPKGWRIFFEGVIG